MISDEVRAVINSSDVIRSAISSMGPDELAEHGLMRLPKDANGVPIRIGDKLITNHSKRVFVVTRLNYSQKHEWMIGGADRKYGLYAPLETRHYEPTVEDVLGEFAIACEDTGNAGPAVATLIAEYARQACPQGGIR